MSKAELKTYADKEVQVYTTGERHLDSLCDCMPVPE